MPFRKVPLVVGKVYHVFTKSISKLIVFPLDDDYKRMLQAIFYYSFEKPPCKLSFFIERGYKDPIISNALNKNNSPKLVKVIGYCLMPTHIHFILQQIMEGGISKFINMILKSYTKYFNTKHNRKGPLWEGRFKSVLVETDEQLLHLTRYIHLNPVSAYLVNSPEDWFYSSYNEYIGKIPNDQKICEFDEYIKLSPQEYKNFVEERIDYQRELEKIKHLILQ